MVFCKQYDFYVFFDYDLFVNGEYFPLLQKIEKETGGDHITVFTLEKKLGEIRFHPEVYKDEGYPCLVLNVDADPESEWDLLLKYGYDGFSRYFELCFNPVLFGSGDEWALYLHKYDEIGVLGFNEQFKHIVNDFAMINGDYILSSGQIVEWVRRTLLHHNPQYVVNFENNLLKNYPFYK